MRGSAALCAALLAACVALSSAGDCSSYSKNGVGPIASEENCRSACITAEGIDCTKAVFDRQGPCEDFKTSAEGGTGVECTCMDEQENHRDVCKDSTFVSSSVSLRPRLVSSLLVVSVALIFHNALGFLFG
eukprot:CAMPEP_0184289564 /NCGR_PEP_ID=MMETSP1049-20130417/1999_1 /TAXON_ID=77928 /ORGANISM="Proteomonas sulcata, Strain CCMP704" /LENGTH=130 /DNA_ID=CAMNT_0026596419 /DNA_START=151 /DNA_END=543 /DNA_ORIENTATION=-